MKILVLPKPIEGVSREELLRHAAAEIQAVWELYAQGICREFYERADQPGRVVLLFECATIEAAKEALARLPFAQLHLIDFDLIPLAPFAGLSRLFKVGS
jgi:hypothetical protein